MEITYNESRIDLVVNKLQEEKQLEDIDFAQYQNQLFLVPDNSVLFYFTDNLPEASEAYYDMYYVPKYDTTQGTRFYRGDYIYVCDKNTDSDSDVYPYYWRQAFKVKYEYDTVADVADIPGI